MGIKASSSDIKVRGLKFSSFACRFLFFCLFFFARAFVGRNATLLSSLLPFAVGIKEKRKPVFTKTKTLLQMLLVLVIAPNCKEPT